MRRRGLPACLRTFLHACLASAPHRCFCLCGLELLQTRTFNGRSGAPVLCRTPPAILLLQGRPCGSGLASLMQSGK
jgi:hypothetical protein